MTVTACFGTVTLWSTITVAVLTRLVWERDYHNWEIFRYWVFDCTLVSFYLCLQKLFPKIIILILTNLVCSKRKKKKRNLVSLVSEADHKVSCRSWGNLSWHRGKWGTKIANKPHDGDSLVGDCMCVRQVCQCECVRLWSESEWAISPAAALLSLSLSLRGGSLSRGRRWKWARPCSKCGDLVANPSLFPLLSPLNDAYCILPKRRRRRRRGMGPQLPCPHSQCSSANLEEQPSGDALILSIRRTFRLLCLWLHRFVPVVPNSQAWYPYILWIFFFFFYTSTIEGLLKRAPASEKILHGQKQFPAKFEEIWLISHDVCVHLLMNNNKIYSF